MVKFISLFLGLVAGLQPVELAVSPQVATVELRLDGRPIAQLREEPWVVACDFGTELAPHHLEVIARDAEGKILGREEQWINLPRERIVLELRTEGDPPQSAQLLWRTIDGVEPDVLRVVFDGEELELDAQNRVRLPKFDPEVPHLLAAELQYGRESARTEIVVGGIEGDRVDRALTAFPVFWNGKGKPPQPEEMRGWLRSQGRDLKVVAVDEGPSEILMVQDQSRQIQGLLGKLEREVLSMTSDLRRRPSGLKHGDRLRILLPVLMEVRSDHPLDLFPLSADLAALREGPRSTGVGRRQVAAPVAEGILKSLPFSPGGAIYDEPQRLADAVAVAGLAAASGGRPRVVVLVTDPDTVDHSSHAIRSVRSYLASLQVPLVVWTPAKSEEWETWGEARNIRNRNFLFRQVRELRALLDRQLVVWVEGRHLPSAISITDAAGDTIANVSSGGTMALPDPEFETWLAGLDPVPEAAPEPAAPGAAPVPSQAPSSEAVAPEVAAAGVAEKAAEAPTSTFADQVSVRVVHVDVVATQDGEKIRDLEREDFALFEDGEPVEIAYFTAPPPARPVADSGSADTTAASDPAVDSGSQKPTFLVVYVDAANLEAKHRKQIFPALREVLVTDPLPGKVMLVVQSLGTSVRQTFTEDPQELAAALDELENGAGAPPARSRIGRRLVGEMMQYLEAISSAERIRDPLSREQAVESANSQRSNVLHQLHAHGESLRIEGMELLASLEGLVEGLGGVEGRKALVYVGDRLTLEPAAELYTAAERILELEGFELTKVVNEGRALSLARDFRAMLRKANGRGVTMYTMTPPDVEMFYSAENMSFGDGLFQNARGLSLAGVSTQLGDVRLAGIKSAACMMSSDTGGLCQVGGTEPRLLLERTLDDLDASYTLAYVPDRQADGELHELEVEVDREGVKVRHREAYLDVLEVDRVLERLQAALRFAAEEDPLGIELAVEPSVDFGKKKLRVLPLEVRVPVSRLAMLPIPENPEKRGSKLELYLTVLDRTGRHTEVQKLPLSFQVAASRLADPRPLVYAHKVNLTIPTGATRVAVGLWDTFGETGSFAGRPIEGGGE